MKLTGGICCLAFLHTANAGSMGPISTFNGQGINPFISLEGSISWLEVGDLNYSLLNSVSAPSSTARVVVDNDLRVWGGRIAAGFTYPYKSNIDFTAETGWSDFGSASFNRPGQVSGKYSLNGPDILVGAIYKYNNFEWFAKVGTLFQRTASNVYFPNLSIPIAGTTVNSTILAKGDSVDVLPEVKLGMIYDINSHWGVSLAYLHAFGDKPEFNGRVVATPGTTQTAFSINARVPSLNSALLGLKYNFGV